MDKGTTTPQASERAGHKDWERIVFGSNSIGGTIRLIVYITASVVVFGSIFHFAA